MHTGITTARCIEIAINNPPKSGDKVEIFNQVAETLRVRDLANLISSKTGCGVRNLGTILRCLFMNNIFLSSPSTNATLRFSLNSKLKLYVDIQYHKKHCPGRSPENPRKEDAENELDVSNEKFCNLGLTPITLEGMSCRPLPNPNPNHHHHLRRYVVSTTSTISILT